jgi:hypothetical protein
MLREAYLVRLDKEFGPRTEFSNTWEEVVDEQIYTSNGLRMAYSRKINSCPNCKNNEKKKNTCLECAGEGRIEDDRVYEPTMYIDGDGHLDPKKTEHLQQNVYAAVKTTSIRLSERAEKTPGFEAYKGAPNYDIQSIDPKQVKTKKKKNSSTDNNGQEFVVLDNGPKNIDDRIRVDPSDRKFQTLLRFIRERMGAGRWKHIQGKDMYRNMSGTQYIMRVKGEGSSYCMNKGDDHNSATIYFVLTTEGVVQRCWSRKKIKRRYDYCQKYSSVLERISIQMRSLFFSPSHRDMAELYSLKNQFANAPVGEKCKIISQVIAKYEDKWGKGCNQDQSPQSKETARINPHLGGGLKRSRETDEDLPTQKRPVLLPSREYTKLGSGQKRNV